MTFPREEWEDIRRQLDTRGWCGTTRVEREYEKWSKHNVGDVVDSDVGRIRIISMQHLDDALRDHPFREENEKWAGWLKGKEGVFIRFERANAAAAAVGMALDPALEKETRRLEPAEVRDALGPDVADALGAGVPVYLISADAVADKPWFPAASMTRLGLLIVGKPVSYADPDFGEFSVFDYSDAKGALHGVSAAGFIRYSYELEQAAVAPRKRAREEEPETKIEEERREIRTRTITPAEMNQLYHMNFSAEEAAEPEWLRAAAFTTADVQDVVDHVISENDYDVLRTENLDAREIESLTWILGSYSSPYSQDIPIVLMLPVSRRGDSITLLGGNLLTWTEKDPLDIESLRFIGNKMLQRSRLPPPLEKRTGVFDKKNYEEGKKVMHFRGGNFRWILPVKIPARFPRF